MGNPAGSNKQPNRWRGLNRLTADFNHVSMTVPEFKKWAHRGNFAGLAERAELAPRQTILGKGVAA